MKLQFRISEATLLKQNAGRVSSETGFGTSEDALDSVEVGGNVSRLAQCPTFLGAPSICFGTDGLAVPIWIVPKCTHDITILGVRP
jgi:hypothetical protein